MPADRLNPTHTESHPRADALEKTEQAVLAVLAGAELGDAATLASMEPTDLAAAAQIYQQAGRHALHQATHPGWWQLYLHFAEWDGAEKTAAEHLAPLLHHAESHGDISAWWFIRKRPCWRLRLFTPPASDARDRIGTALDHLAAAGRIERWWTGIYEPETMAFGGTTGIRIAHELFHADSRAILLDLHRHHSPLGRRELSLLLCTMLMRAAGLERYEMGDVWHRVATERPPPADIPMHRIAAMTQDLRHLIRADTAPDGPMLGPDGPLAFAAEWTAAFREAGRTLGNAARDGTLDRGLRQILAYHVIFHWNRLGLPTRTQRILARAALHAITEI
ncbi:thiopeptide-type bacteriocin biosynthesis protein [Streptomyces sp. 4N509B]|uniref:thiopeptide-type bacteriocin biosynthesis protein n=1 Tax=Streptomyces sp. 4N509B TaxID=3457413 RepID=UPI003FD435F5